MNLYQNIQRVRAAVYEKHVRNVLSSTFRQSLSSMTKLAVVAERLKKRAWDREVNPQTGRIKSG